MDFRLISRTRKWMEENGLIGDCDVISVAGASKSLVDGSEAVRNFFLDQIAVAAGLHGASQVILLHHSDCGAYKLTYGFSSPKEERSRQEEDMDKAKQIILNKFPGTSVLKIWARMQDSDGKRAEFETLG